MTFIYIKKRINNKSLVQYPYLETKFNKFSSSKYTARSFATNPRRKTKLMKKSLGGFTISIDGCKTW